MKFFQHSINGFPNATFDSECTVLHRIGALAVVAMIYEK